jgi:hypothetical protein
MDQPPWHPGDSPAERQARQEAYDRLVAAAQRAGEPIRKLHQLLTTIAVNETETRRFLSEEVYGVPDDLLDDLLSLRLRELDDPG